MAAARPVLHQALFSRQAGREFVCATACARTVTATSVGASKGTVIGNLHEWKVRLVENVCWRDTPLLRKGQDYEYKDVEVVATNLKRGRTEGRQQSTCVGLRASRVLGGSFIRWQGPWFQQCCGVAFNASLVRRRAVGVCTPAVSYYAVGIYLCMSPDVLIGYLVL